MSKKPAIDPQVALSNERTFLSWIRTSLALTVTGAALVALNLPIDTGWRMASGGIFVLLGIVAAVQAWFGWHHTDRELSEGRGVPRLRIGIYVTAGVTVAALVLAVGAIVT